ncbi:MAG TPA: hypothetical protein VFN22_05370 [Gemmatimonadales bacterium]|nr:hypothetical protein [Gemmatimonadales bacterium]
MTAPILRPLSMGEVLDTAFGLYRNQFVALVTIAAVLQILPGLLGVYLEVTGLSTTNLGLMLLVLFIGFVFSSIAVAASTFVISGAYLGRQVTAGEAIPRALAFLLPLMVLSALSGLLITVGFLLLIIPGFIAIAGLALANAALVIETPISPMDAMRRSWELTKGARGKVMTTIFVGSLLLVIPMIVVSVIGVIGSALGLWPIWISPVLTLALRIFVYPFVYVVVVVLYYDMRVRKEGFDLELMASATGTG